VLAPSSHHVAEQGKRSFIGPMNVVNEDDSGILTPSIATRREEYLLQAFKETGLCSWTV
jgi:hypothetical protein